MDAPRFSPTIALLTLARSAEVDAARILEPEGLSLRKLGILQRLASLPGATASDLARSVGVTGDDVASMLRGLTASGLVRRGRDGMLSLSEQGSAALARVDAALTRLDERLFAERPALSGELIEATTPRDAGPPLD